MPAGGLVEDAGARQLEAEKERLQDDLARAEDLAGFYRRQVRLEANMALVRIAG